MRQLLSPAFTVAMLGAIESLMSAVVSDRMSDDKHNPNVELDGPRRRQHRLAVVWRAAGHGRHRAHRNEHPRRRQDSGRGNDSRTDFAGHRALRRAVGAHMCRWRRLRQS